MEDVEQVGKTIVLEGHALEPQDADRWRKASERVGRCQRALTEANMALEELRMELVGEYSQRADREEYA